MRKEHVCKYMLQYWGRALYSRSLLKEINIIQQTENYSVLSYRECVLFFTEWKNFENRVGDTALQRHCKWNNAANYVPSFTGNPLGSLSNIHQPQIFRTGAISGDIIACQLQRCATGIYCRNSQDCYLACRCYCWW